MTVLLSSVFDYSSLRLERLRPWHHNATSRRRIVGDGRLRFRGHLSLHSPAVAAHSSIGRIAIGGTGRSTRAPATLRVSNPFAGRICSGGLEGGMAGVGQLLGQGGRWRFGIGWYAVAIVLAPLIWAVSLGVALLLGGREPEVRRDYLVPVAAIGEEFGWRGYAPPRLQERMGAWRVLSR